MAGTGKRIGTVTAAALAAMTRNGRAGSGPPRAHGGERRAPVRWEVRTGRVSQIATDLRRALGAYARHSAGFKVGVSAYPDRRWSKYRDDEGDWRVMVVIYQTTSPDSVRDAESLLVEHGWERHPDKIRNKTGGGGGGGGAPPGGAEYYYVYVVLA